MYQSWVFASALVAGSGLFAYAATMGPSSPIATPPPAVDAVRVLPPEPPTTIAEPAPDPVVVLEPIVVEARQAPRVKAKPKVQAPSPTDRPCSSWRELGPTNVTKGKTTGSVSVRELCP